MRERRFRDSRGELRVSTCEEEREKDENPGLERVKHVGRYSQHVRVVS